MTQMRQHMGSSDFVKCCTADSDIHYIIERADVSSCMEKSPDKGTEIVAFAIKSTVTDNIVGEDPLEHVTGQSKPKVADARLTTERTLEHMTSMVKRDLVG